MNLSNKVDTILDDVLDHCEEYLEMIPNVLTRQETIIKLLAALVARERMHNEYLTKRIEAIERRL